MVFTSWTCHRFSSDASVCKPIHSPLDRYGVYRRQNWHLRVPITCVAISYHRWHGIVPDEWGVPIRTTLLWSVTKNFVLFLLMKVRDTFNKSKKKYIYNDQEFSFCPFMNNKWPCAKPLLPSLLHWVDDCHHNPRFWVQRLCNYQISKT